ncbi:S9 family peptidase [Chitinophaga sp. CF418]|uniref:alpha/beta hydrolase family protein n=1 Tax=Chitinophaga sp. CF418 TaxID=1855287 RepID=UPI00091592DA|nr:prolyl oligopeptidase family serine peptidase [Chitinophaga sp. CF418]SHN41848.1 Dipeptidyl aminopeptidase/acylaminoacyl peptidase [Chitinophaga sp. CF418]
MKIVYFLICFIVATVNKSPGQKLPIDSSVYKDWTSVNSHQISNDGKYVAYTIENQPEGQITKVILSSRKDWKKIIIGCHDIKITEDSKYAIYEKNGILYILMLGTDKILKIENIISYKISAPNFKRKQWLAYKVKGDGDLFVRDLSNGEERQMQDIREYEFNKDATMLLIQKIKSPKDVVLQLVDLKDWEIASIWTGHSIDNLVFSSDCSQLAFIARNENQDDEFSSIYYYKNGMRTASVLFTNNEDSVPMNMRILSLYKFSEDNSRLFIYSAERPKSDSAKKNDPIQLNIWSYKDSELQTLQQKKIAPKGYLAALWIESRKIVNLETEEYQIYLPYFVIDDDWVEGSKAEFLPGRLTYRRYYLTSTRDNQRIEFPTVFTISPDGKFVVYYNSKARNYCSYEIRTRVTRDISKSLVIKNFDEVYDLSPGRDISSFNVAGWTDNNEVIFRDKYDIWKMDLLGGSSPYCMTNKLGERNKTVFCLSSDDKRKVYNSKERPILIAFDTRTKQNGFYRASFKKDERVQLLSMGPYSYFVPIPEAGIDAGNMPIKAKDVDEYILSRGTAYESVNYYLTSDFKSFKKLSDIHPESKYNWLTTELHSWKTLDSSYSQGVLFKPENFDKGKKYPIIFYYYEKLSEGLNVFRKPEPSDGRLNIPWFVSNGYLVFTPDIYYKQGEPGKSAYDYVVSAAKYMAKFPFVDSSRMGIQGISHGGFETNYLVTHSSIFKAACSASGTTDLISMYGGLNAQGESLQEYYENGQGRLGQTLWKNKDSYIRNSPIFEADKVNTPLLLFHTSFDGVVPFTQAVSFYLALRRLGKKVWLLEYGDGNHGVWGRSAMDFDLRMQQFFNHYLKNELPPKWMTKGRPAQLRGVNDMLELDTSGDTP